MPDLVISGPVSTADRTTQTQSLQIAEPITAGSPVYEDTTTDSKLRPGEKTVAASSVIRGIALTSGAAVDDYILVSGVSGNIVTGAPAMNPGQVYYLSSAGAVGEFADLGSGEYATPLYQASSATEAILMINNNSVLVP